VVTLAYAPRGAQYLGDLEASCEAPDAGLEQASLSDVLCTQSLLTAALRQVTAEVGGSLLLGVECSSGEPQHTAVVNDPPVTKAYCTGVAAVGHAGGLKPLPSAELGLAESSVLDAWAIQIRTRLSPGARSLAVQAPHGIAPGRPSQIVPRLPAFDRPYAAISASCENLCDTQALHSALAAAAAHLGAAHVVIGECVQSEKLKECTGVAGSPHL
jgi:hypothetical protein